MSGGDRTVDGFVELYRAHYSRLVAALTLSGAQPAQAQDLAQEAFARTYRHWRRVTRGSNPAGYVYTVAFRLARRAWRADAPAGGRDGEVPGPEDGALCRMSVEDALQAMPARRRQCAALCFLVGMTAVEAAAALDIDASTVRVQLHRARADLRRALGAADAVTVS